MPPTSSCPLPASSSQADMHVNIDYMAPNGAPDNDRKMKEASWLTGQVRGRPALPHASRAAHLASPRVPLASRASRLACLSASRASRSLTPRASRCQRVVFPVQAFIESLRYYPKGTQALENNDCEATYSGCTHSARQVVAEHIETDVRVRLGIAPADQEWRDEQCPREWFPEKRPAMIKHMAKVRARLKR